jgi:hypothetical protein
MIEIMRKIMPARKAYALAFLAFSSSTISASPKIEVSIAIGKETFANVAVVKRAVLKNLSSDSRGMMVKLPTIQQPLINSKARPTRRNHVKGFSVIITESEIYFKSYQGFCKHHMACFKEAT